MGYYWLYDRYLTRLIVFDCDKVGNLGNLSCIDPAVLGIKDTGKNVKNAIHLFGHRPNHSSAFPLSWL